MKHMHYEIKFDITIIKSDRTMFEIQFWLVIMKRKKINKQISINLTILFTFLATRRRFFIRWSSPFNSDILFSLTPKTKIVFIKGFYINNFNWNNNFETPKEPFFQNCLHFHSEQLFSLWAQNNFHFELVSETSLFSKKN